LTLFLTDNALEQLRKFGIDHLKDPPKYSFRSNPRRKAVFSISPLFNYPSFCKNLSTYHINDMMNHVRTRKYGSYKFILIKEILNIFMAESPFFLYMHIENTQHDITQLSGSDTAFTRITELDVSAYVDSSILHRLSQLCRHIKRLNLIDGNDSNQGLISLINVQTNLTHVTFRENYKRFWVSREHKQTISIGNALNSKLDSIISLDIGIELQSALRILPRLAQNLKEFKFKVNYWNRTSSLINDFYLQLESVKFQNLEVLEITFFNPPFRVLARLIEKTGGELRKIILGNIRGSSDSYIEEIGQLFISISLHCPKLEYLDIWIRSDVNDLLRLFSTCRRLKELTLRSLFNFYKLPVFEVLTKNSPPSLYKLKVDLDANLVSKMLERFLEMWQERSQMRSLDLTIFRGWFNDKEKEKIVKKFKDNGVLNRFKHEDKS